VRTNGWIGYVAHIGDVRNAYKIFVGKPEKKDRLADLEVYGF